jgi:hypothetical protein
LGTMATYMPTIARPFIPFISVKLYNTTYMTT